VRDEFGLLAPGEGWRERLLDGFHRLYYEAGEAGGTWKDTTFLGVTTWKSPSTYGSTRSWCGSCAPA
jgi:cephalosporin hydroxylase